MRIKKEKEDRISHDPRKLRIFDIAELSVHDGPGVRTVVYFQGCNARCDWCHSPHSQAAYAPLLYNANLCSNCKRCALVCPNKVHQFRAGKHELNRAACTQCGICIENCPNSISGVKGSALHLPTVTVSVTGLFHQIEPYLKLTRLNGGITLSGGEALLQKKGVEKLLEICQKKGYHTAVETSGLLPLETYESVLPQVNLWLFGMRVITGQKGRRNDAHIQQVLDLLTARKAKILPRIPLIPGFFDRDEVLKVITGLLRKYSLQKVSLNPWNRNYDHYYTQSGHPLQMQSPTIDEISACETKIISVLNQLNFSVYETATNKSNNEPENTATL